MQHYLLRIYYLPDSFRHQRLSSEKQAKFLPSWSLFFTGRRQKINKICNIYSVKWQKLKREIKEEKVVSKGSLRRRHFTYYKHKDIIQGLGTWCEFFSFLFRESQTVFFTRISEQAICTLTPTKHTKTFANILSWCFISQAPHSWKSPGMELNKHFGLGNSIKTFFFF